MIGNILAGVYGELAPQGDYESIATVTLGGTQSSIEFTSIPSTYQHLQVRGIARSSTAGTAGDWLYIQVNSDTGSNYSWHQIYGSGSSVPVDAGANQSFMRGGILPRNGNTSGFFGGAVVDILDYKDTNKFKTLRSLWGSDRNGAGEVGLHSGNWRSTNAITSIKLYPEANSLVQYSSFALYGIKG